MTFFLWTLLVLHFISLLMYLAELRDERSFPRVEIKTVGKTSAKAILCLAFIVWICLLLFRAV